MSLLSTAITLFVVANPIGNSPAILSIIKDFDFERQKKIMLRETIIALLIAYFFQYFGKVFLEQLDIQDYTRQFSGGILMFLVALFMIFPSQPTTVTEKRKKEPVIVPIATPLISGPALLSIIILLSGGGNDLQLSIAIGLAWIGVTGVLLAAPYIQKIIQKTGMTVIEQLMGLILAMMGVEMMVQATEKFIKTIGSIH